MPAPVGLILFLKMKHRIITRDARSRAACAIVLACALASLGWGQQSSTSGTKTTSHKHKAASTKKPTSSHPATHKAGTTKSSAIQTASARTRKGKKTAKRTRGQQKIDSERAQEIQSALIREHYLGGDASGTWNQASEEAMRRYQNDHGWQTKEVPDSRALIKLGLGPSKDHLLNPESAMTTVPDAPKAESLPPTSHSASPTSQPQR